LTFAGGKLRGESFWRKGFSAAAGQGQKLHTKIVDARNRESGT
jgi:hypothetical protein